MHTETQLVREHDTRRRAGAPLAPLVTLLRLDRKCCDGASVETLETDRFAGFLAISVGAVIDALAQDASTLATLEAGLFCEITARLEDEARQTRKETAATKVDFFTMVRGED